jgi:hypothetical protein
MAIIHEIQQVILVQTIHGEGLSLFLIDYGPNLNTIWVIANCNDGKIRHYDSNDIVLKRNDTLKLNDKK